jgi:hypothetical protein
MVPPGEGLLARTITSSGHAESGTVQDVLEPYSGFGGEETRSKRALRDEARMKT